MNKLPRSVRRHDEHKPAQTSKAKVVPSSLTAADLLKDTHPLHAAFVKWGKAKGQEPSKRQGRKFLQTFPQFRDLPKAA